MQFPSQLDVDVFRRDRIGLVLLWDSEIPGFLLKVTPSGRRIYFLDYYIDGRRRRIKLCEHGTKTVDEARRAARDKLGILDEGIDPHTVKEQAKEAPTIAKLADDYLERYSRPHKKARSVHDDLA